MTVRYRRAERVIAKEVDGEVLLVPIVDRLVDLDDCMYLLADEVALAVWRALDAPRTLGELAAHVAAGFDVTEEAAGRDLVAFLGDLVRVGAVVEEEAAR